MVRVEFFGPLRSLAGVSEVVLEVEGRARLGDVLKMLPAEVRRYVVDDAGKPQAGVLVLVNGSDVRYLGWLETEVGGDDTVVIIPSIHGGWGG